MACKDCEILKEWAKCDHCGGTDSSSSPELPGYKPDLENDLSFLLELRGKISDGFERKDPTLIEYSLTMLDDWIEELQTSL